MDDCWAEGGVMPWRLLPIFGTLVLWVIGANTDMMARASLTAMGAAVVGAVDLPMSLGVAVCAS